MILDNEAAYVALLYKEQSDQWKAKHDTLADVARCCIAAVLLLSSRSATRH